MANSKSGNKKKPTGKSSVVSAGAPESTPSLSTAANTPEKEQSSDKTSSKNYSTRNSGGCSTLHNKVTGDHHDNINETASSRTGEVKTPQEAPLGKTSTTSTAGEDSSKRNSTNNLTPTNVSKLPQHQQQEHQQQIQNLNMDLIRRQLLNRFLLQHENATKDHDWMEQCQKFAKMNMKGILDEIVTDAVNGEWASFALFYQNQNLTQGVKMLPQPEHIHSLMLQDAEKRYQLWRELMIKSILKDDSTGTEEMIAQKRVDKFQKIDKLANFSDVFSEDGQEMKKHFYYDREDERHCFVMNGKYYGGDLHDTFEVKEIPGKGFGVLAKRDLEIGQLILEEFPILEATKRKIAELAIKKREKVDAFDYFFEEFRNLPEKAQKAILDLQGQDLGRETSDSGGGYTTTEEEEEEEDQITSSSKNVVENQAVPLSSRNKAAVDDPQRRKKLVQEKKQLRKLQRQRLRVRDIAKTNTIEQAGRRRLFLTLSRFNHSCAPNCGWEQVDESLLPQNCCNKEKQKTMHEKQGKDLQPLALQEPAEYYCFARVRATKKIRKGEELTFPYIALFPGADERRAQLRRNWGFWCTCPACEAEEDAAEAVKRGIKMSASSSSSAGRPGTKNNTTQEESDPDEMENSMSSSVTCTPFATINKPRALLHACEQWATKKSMFANQQDERSKLKLPEQHAKGYHKILERVHKEDPSAVSAMQSVLEAYYMLENVIGNNKKQDCTDLSAASLLLTDNCNEDRELRQQLLLQHQNSILFLRHLDFTNNLNYFPLVLQYKFWSNMVESWMQIRILRHEKDTMAKMQAFVQQRRESPIEFLKIQIADLSAENNTPEHTMFRCGILLLALQYRAAYFAFGPFSKPTKEAKEFYDQIQALRSLRHRVLCATENLEAVPWKKEKPGKNNKENKQITVEQMLRHVQEINNAETEDAAAAKVNQKCKSAGTTEAAASGGAGANSKKNKRKNKKK
ncbi:unnamed protein product [Amoebophrya sp. A120]|nr:unnamed protein product [Amoebophrya sp. A120]|eukprot:GSA120T00008197001.1